MALKYDAPTYGGIGRWARLTQADVEDEVTRRHTRHLRPLPELAELPELPELPELVHGIPGARPRTLFGLFRRRAEQPGQKTGCGQ